MTDRTLVQVEIATLRPHPRQADFFGNLATAAFEALVDDIRRNGLRHPIEITPDGTIVCGHQRVRAALALGWTEIDAFILDENDPRDIERRLIQDNLTRRQIGPVGMARIYKALIGSARNEGSSNTHGDLRDQIAKRLGNRSGRTLDRYLRLLNAPREVQDAVESGRISRATAERVLELTESAREQLAKDIKAGKDVAKVIAQALGANGERDVIRARKEYGSVLLHLRRSLPLLKKYTKRIAGFSLPSPEAAKLLKSASLLLQRLADAERKK